jgi:CRP-like cAMP-binding protein
LTDAQLESVAAAVKQTSFKKGDAIVNYGDVGELFYMIKEGEVVCVVPGGDGPAGRRSSIPLTLTAGQYFGERALLNDVTRGADVIAQSDTTVCLTLDRQNFANLLGPMKDIIKSNLARQCLQSIPFLASALSAKQLSKVATTAEEERFDQNEYVLSVNSGAHHGFYIIKDGEIGVVDMDGNVIELLHAGQYFGEQALMSHAPTDPTLSYYVSGEDGANFFKFTRTKFESAAGISLRDGLAAAGASLAAAESSGEGDDAATTVGAQSRKMNPDKLTLEELERKKILGEGTFGRVYLVRAARSKYAEHYGEFGFV